jgi:simple sugar transport system permease protein
MSELFTETAIVATLAATLRLAMPLLLAGLGEMYGQRSGVLNLGVEGVMLLGGFFAYWTTLSTDSPWLGLLAGLAVGLIMGLLNGVISVTLRAQQGISGIGVYLFGLGLSDLLFQKIVGTPRLIDPLAQVEIWLLRDIPWIGDFAFRQRSIVYIAFLLVPLSIWVLNKTTFGLNIRAVGENPASADSLGVSVGRTRYVTLTIGGVLAGAAGAGLVLTTVHRGPGVHCDRARVLRGVAANRRNARGAPVRLRPGAGYPTQGARVDSGEPAGSLQHGAGPDHYLGASGGLPTIPSSDCADETVQPRWINDKHESRLQGREKVQNDEVNRMAPAGAAGRAGARGRRLWRRRRWGRRGFSDSDRRSQRIERPGIHPVHSGRRQRDPNGNG